MKKVQRHQILLAILSRCDESSALSISELHQRLNLQGVDCNRKTVERDMENLSAMGLAQTETSPARFYMSDDYRGEVKLSFTKAELQIMLLSLNALKESGPVYFNQMIDATSSKVLNQLNRGLKADMLNFQEQFLFSSGIQPKTQAFNQEDFDIVLQALRQKISFHCLYSSPYRKDDQIRIRHFTPYLFFLSGLVPYVCCYDLASKSFKNLRISRIEKARLDETTAITKYLNEARDFVKNGFGAFSSPESVVDIKLEIKGKFLTFCNEQTLHPTQSLQLLENKHGVLSLSVPVSYELIRLFASFGDDIVKVDPEKIGLQVLELASSTLDNLKKAS